MAAAPPTVFFPTQHAVSGHHSTSTELKHELDVTWQTLAGDEVAPSPSALLECSRLNPPNADLQQLRGDMQTTEDKITALQLVLECVLRFALSKDRRDKLRD